MFPFRDHNPTGRIPYVTLALIVLNVGVFILGFITLNTDQETYQFYAKYAMIPAEITSGTGYGTLVSSMFLHGGFMHILGNMLFLWIFGDNLENRMGHVGFILFYMLAGFGASFLQIYSAPGSTVPNIGASGAIAGVMGGYLLLYPRAKVDCVIFIVIFFTVITLPAFAVLLIWFGLQLFSGFIDQSSQGGVAYWAHVGGFVSGILLTLPFWLRDGGTRLWRRTHGHPPFPETHYKTTRIPKVSR